MDPISHNIADDFAVGSSSSPDAVRTDVSKPNPLAASYLFLLFFFVAYCVRPEDWVPGVAGLPLAKIAGILCALAFITSAPRIGFSLSREAKYMTLLVLQLWLTVPFSRVWRGGAFYTTLDFSKVLMIVFVIGATVTNLHRLVRLIFIQTTSAAVIAAVTLTKGVTLIGRIQGAVHGIYENSNDLALILVITLPFCIAFLLRTESWLRRALWAAASGLLVYDLLRTGSRSGLIGLLVCGAVCLREFGIRGRKLALVAGAVGAALLIALFAGDTVSERFRDIFNDQPNTEAARAAYGSSVQRQQLLWRALEVTTEHPLLGIGPGNFNSVSGSWHDPHNSYTQMSSEGGIPALILYLLLLWCALSNLRKTNQLVRPDSEEALFAMALRSSLYGFLVTSFFSSSAYQFFPYFLVAYTSALLVIAESKAAAEPLNKITEESFGDYAEPATVSFAG